MAGREKGPLTEPMFYVLMSFLHRELCGTEVGEFVERKTAGRVKLGPGTLYTLLAKFQDEELRRAWMAASGPTASPAKARRLLTRSWRACAPV